MDKHLFLKQLESIIEDETNVIANLANISAFLNQSFDRINWVGFYLLEGRELVLGPFQGKVACVRIPVGKGVCGTAVYRNRVIRVDDVHQFKGHIACDSESRSEIVLPITINHKVYGVLDIDSPDYSRFTKGDEDLLSDAIEIIKKVFKKANQ